MKTPSNEHVPRELESTDKVQLELAIAHDERVPKDLRETIFRIFAHPLVEKPPQTVEAEFKRGEAKYWEHSRPFEGDLSCQVQIWLEPEKDGWRGNRYQRLTTRLSVCSKDIAKYPTHSQNTGVVLMNFSPGQVDYIERFFEKIIYRDGTVAITAECYSASRYQPTPNREHSYTTTLSLLSHQLVRTIMRDFPDFFGQHKTIAIIEDLSKPKTDDTRLGTHSAFSHWAKRRALDLKFTQSKHQENRYEYQYQ